MVKEKVMNHYVFLKIPTEHYTASFASEMERVMNEAQNVIQGFERYQILNEAQPGSELVSLLIVLTFTSQTEKDNYLQHALHRALLQQIKPVVAEKAVFDSLD